MNVNLLAINVGNTRTRIGVFVDGKIELAEAIDNRELENRLPELLTRGWDMIGQKQAAAVMLASVVPAVQERIEKLAGKTLAGQKIYRVEQDLPIPIGRQLDRESIVGDDRLLNAAAAYDHLKQAVIIVDVGTAITVDFVDGAVTFHGGAIGPGPRMMLESLHQAAAQLPQVSFARPEEPIGHNTVEAMRSAIFHGLRGMVRELAEQFATQVGSYPLVIATGGDAEQLLSDYELVERIVPDLTILGMAVTLQSALRDDAT